jgi:hypothetical protein
MLLPPPPKFPGFAAEDFEVFEIPDREARRRAIIDAFHPGLKLLADDLLLRLNEPGTPEFHAHVPRLDWPKGYVPFCTWLALSKLPHGYQAGPQLNVGIHTDFVAARLAWDTSADAFGRFQFRCKVAGLGETLSEVAEASGLMFRVYAAAPWPEGSRCVFASGGDWDAAFTEVARRGVWWEVGRRWDLPEAGGLVGSPAWSDAVAEVLLALRPLFEKID